MTEKARELLSVLMDGEASEIEIHRLLRQRRCGFPVPGSGIELPAVSPMGCFRANRLADTTIEVKMLVSVKDRV